jgi:hypothetical protein
MSCVAGPAFLKGMYDAALQGRSYIDHVYFYESTRNYIFPEVFTEALDYHLEEGPECWGWVNQGFIDVMGCLLAEHIPIEFYYYGQDRDTFMKNMQNHLTTYVNNPDKYNWFNVWNQKMLPWDSRSSLDNLFAGLLVFLYQNYGGIEFLKRWFSILSTLVHRKPASKSDHQGARDNFFLASCYAAQRDLTEQFERLLRWPISDEAKFQMFL